MSLDETYMKTCLELGQQALESGNPPVGAILVYQGQIIGEGIENGKTTGDITNHAEIEAVRDAIRKGNQTLLAESVMYTTHEPCIMCAYVIRHHKIPRIVFGSSVPDIGGHSSKFNILSTEEVPKWGTQPQVIAGVCKDDCEALTTAFIQKLQVEKKD